MHRIILVTVAALLCLASVSLAQTTGSFQLSIDFNEEDYDYTRNLYYFVPNDYDSSQAYKLVVGFRGGPHSNAGQFRNQLQFFADSIGAIVLCPENSSHFNTDEGLTKQLFRYSVDSTAAMYNIDRDFIYLTGLSYGGRHAVIVAMDTDNGPIPGLRGVIPFATGQNGHLQPNYDAVAEFAPACVCIGLNDNATFKNVANSLHDDIVDNGGKSFLNEIAGVGHTVAFPTYPDEMMECIAYIESQYETSAVRPAVPEDIIDISIFPNPASSQIQLQMGKGIDVKELYVTDASSRKLRQYEPDSRELDITNLPSGTLYVVIVSNDGVETGSFIKY